MTKKAFRSIFLDTLPVLAGYLFLGAGFGILLAEKTQYGPVCAGAMALFIFAGSGQYLAVNLLATNASIFSAALATFLLNARHIFYGISLLEPYKGAKSKPYLVFALTDETYSLVTQKSPPAGVSRHTYCFLVSCLDHSYWILGCVLGGLVGTYLPINFQGVEFVLTALFVTLFTEQWLTTKRHVPAIIGILCTLACLLLFGTELFLIPSMVAIALILMLMGKTGKGETADA